MAKKRYQITLTSEKVEEFYQLSKVFGSQATMSNLFDNYLGQYNQMLRGFVESGNNFTVSDLFKFLGNSLEEVQRHDTKKVHAGKETKTGRKTA
ncbi:MAG TPA: hypothetical protein V6C97_27040 [Oculatellaceae cyanobacterium]